MILTTHSFFLNHDAKQLGRMMPYAPLSNLIASARLRAEGHQVSHFDATFAQGIEDFEAVLDRSDAPVVALLEDNFHYLTKMCTAGRRRDALAMVAAAKKRGRRVLVNGPDSTDRPEIYLAAGADAVLLGDGEAQLLEVAALWRANPKAELDGVAGLALGRKPVWHRAPARALQALAQAVPAWDLADVESYRRAWMKKHGYFSWNVVTSRGCPYACNWCAKPTFGRGYQQRSAVAVAAELRQLKDQIGPDHIWFADDIFGLTPQWLEEFAQAVADQDARIPFMMQSRVNLMRRESVDSLVAAGAQEVWLGVESGSQKILDAMDKGSAVSQARMATRNLKARGIRACWFIQLGYPGEDWNDILLTRDLIRDEGPDDIGVSVAYPLPGTVFHDRVKAQLSAQHNWEDSDELAMLFQGTFPTHFYRDVRDLLHEEAGTGRRCERDWARLGELATKHIAENALLATGS